MNMIQAHEAARGQAILAQVKTYIDKREAIIMSKLVASCESGVMTPDEMRNGIAGIAALRGLTRDIERDVRVALDKRASTMTATAEE